MDVGSKQTHEGIGIWDSYDLEVFWLPQSDGDVYYAKVPDEWTCYEVPKNLAVPTPVVHAYLMGLAMEVTDHEGRLITRIAEVECNVLPLSAFFDCFFMVRRGGYHTKF